MTPFSDIDTKRLKRLTQKMDESGKDSEWWRSVGEASWEQWFAWRPVKVHGRWTWLKTVYRKYSWAKSTEQPFGKEYDYGDIFDVLKND